MNNFLKVFAIWKDSKHSAIREFWWRSWNPETYSACLLSWKYLRSQWYCADCPCRGRSYW